jgi:hypothetical protein
VIGVALLFLKGVFTRIFEGVVALVKLALAHPREALIIVLCCLSAWLWRGNVARDDKIADLTTKHAEFVAASEQAAEMYKAREANAQRQHFESAKEAQTAYDEISQDLNTALARYRAANRLPRGSAYCGPAPAPSEGGDPVVPAEVPPDTGMVAIRETDLQALVDWLAVAVPSHNAAVIEIEEGRAIPAPDFSTTDTGAK